MECVFGRYFKARDLKKIRTFFNDNSIFHHSLEFTSLTLSPMGSNPTDLPWGRKWAMKLKEV